MAREGSVVLALILAAYPVAGGPLVLRDWYDLRFRGAYAEGLIIGTAASQRPFERERHRDFSLTFRYRPASSGAWRTVTQPVSRATYARYRARDAVTVRYAPHRPDLAMIADTSLFEAGVGRGVAAALTLLGSALAAVSLSRLVVRGLGWMLRRRSAARGRA